MNTVSDDTIEILAPSPTMTPVIEALRSRWAALQTLPTTPVTAYTFEALPVVAFAREFARFTVMRAGFAEGLYPTLDQAKATDLVPHLSLDYQIMSEDDLAEQFRFRVEGANVAAHYRKIAQTPQLKTLLRDENALGWSGFIVDEPVSSHKSAVLHRERMLIDYFRGSVEWSFLRGYDLSRSAMLILEALAVEMISVERAQFYLARTVGEMVLRYSNWRDFARSLLFTMTFMNVSTSEHHALEMMDVEFQRLQTCLTTYWMDFAWPRIKMPSENESN